MGQDPSQFGRWSQISPDAPILEVHAALLPSGRILTFSGSQHDPREHLTPNAICIWDPIRKRYVQILSPKQDLFCCGHAFLGDGRLLVAGGTQKYRNIPGLHGHDHFTGIRDAAIFNEEFADVLDPRTWTAGVELMMHAEPIGNTIPRSYLQKGGGRWYPTLLTLPDGRIFTMSGHPEEEDVRSGSGPGGTGIHKNIMMEIFNYSPMPFGNTRVKPHDGGDRNEYLQEVEHSDPELYVPPVNDASLPPAADNLTAN
jgi:hypothetical protein